MIKMKRENQLVVKIGVAPFASPKKSHIVASVIQILKYTRR